MPYNECYLIVHSQTTNKRFYRYSRTGFHQDDRQFRSDVINHLGAASSQNYITFGRQDREPFGQNWQEI